jgi:putative addiction module antidote
LVALKLYAIGNSIGAVLPQDVLDRLHVQEGDTLYLTEMPDGYLLTRQDPALEAEKGVAREIAKKRRRLLSELAKS